MKTSGVAVTLLLSIFQAFWLTASGEAVQYCRFGSSKVPDSEIDFCMGALMYQNISSNSHDMYLTVKVSRKKGSALGWTAIGPGAIMDGSIMIIIYGDPLGHEDPIVSIRTVNGHHQPILLNQKDLPNGMDLRVIRSSWLPDDNHNNQDSSIPLHVAWVSLVCYSCNLWPGSDISPQSTSQPWIWAWNARQKFDVFTFDAHLNMHKHHAGTGGWGNFYLDMSQSINTARFPPSLPPIRTDVARLGASDTPLLFLDSAITMIVGSSSYFHGLVLATTLLFVFPGGVLSLRVSSPKSFNYHWIIQICGSFLFLLGLSLGLLKSSKINTGHQWVGIALGSCIGIQGFLGLRHHRVFLRLHRRAMVSYLHIWLGRFFLVVGWVNVVSGLLLRGYKPTSATVITMEVFACLQAVGLTWLLAWKRSERAEYTPNPTWVNIDDGDFALSASDDEAEMEEIAKL